MAIWTWLVASVLLPQVTTAQHCDNASRAVIGSGFAYYEQSTAGGYAWPYRVFKSSTLNPPVWQINSSKPDALARGLIFVTTSDGGTGKVNKMPAPQIFTDKGELIFAGPTVNATNFKWQQLDGKPTLSYWSGLSSAGANIGHGYGNVTLLDTSYNVKSVLCPHFGLNTAGGGNFSCEADLHESYITDRNTILVTAYNATTADLSAVNGSANGWIFDCQFYELDINGKVLFKWSSQQHVPVTESRLPIGTSGTTINPYDYFHINSVVNIGDYYLVNSRHCWTVFLIDKLGNIVWRFAGDTGGDFGPLPSNGTFRWQHHTRPHNVTKTTFELSLFNNNNYNPVATQKLPTGLLVYNLPLQPVQNSTKSQAQLVRNFASPEEESDPSQGSYQARLENGNSFASYGQLPLLKEFDPFGAVIWSGRIAPDIVAQVYRGFKEEWHAQPTTIPDFVVLKNTTTSAYNGYVSWNGATDVHRWNVYIGRTREYMEYAGSVDWKGFETVFDIPCWAHYVQVGACEDRREGKRSAVVAVPR